MTTTPAAPRPTRRARSGRIDPTTFGDRPWRIHEITGDFRVEDVWQLPISAGPHDFAEVVQFFADLDIPRASGPVFRFLWRARWVLGALLRWDTEQQGLERAVASLRHRMPADLRNAPSGPELGDSPMRSLYLLEHEFATELANATCHGVMHVGWVRRDDPADFDEWSAQMTVLVKPHGWLGATYLAAIWPVRHAIVYPRMLAALDSAWTRHRSTS